MKVKVGCAIGAGLISIASALGLYAVSYTKPNLNHFEPQSQAPKRENKIIFEQIIDSYKDSCCPENDPSVMLQKQFQNGPKTLDYRIRLQEGETLSELARDAYGSEAAYSIIMDANNLGTYLRNLPARLRKDLISDRARMRKLKILFPFKGNTDPREIREGIEITLPLSEDQRKKFSAIHPGRLY